MAVTVTPKPVLHTLDAADNDQLTITPSAVFIEVIWADGDKSDANVLWVDFAGTDGGARSAQAVAYIPGPSGRQLIEVAGQGFVGVSGSSAFDVHIRASTLR
jgi:hypothetical protein